MPEDVPARVHWTDQERAILRDLWKPYATPPAPEAAVQVSRAQLASVVCTTGTTLRHAADFLTELGFDVPADTSSGPEPTEEDYPLLFCSGQWAWADQEVSLLYMAVVARRIHWPVTAVAERLRELGFTVAPVPDEDQLPSYEQTALVGYGTNLDVNRPLKLGAVAERAEATGIPLIEAIAHFAAQGFKCSVTAEALARAEQDGPTLSVLGRFPDPYSFGPVSPDEVHAVGAEAAGPLRDFGFEVVPPTQAWLRERQLEEDLCQAVQATGHTRGLRRPRTIPRSPSSPWPWWACRAARLSARSPSPRRGSASATRSRTGSPRHRRNRPPLRPPQPRPRQQPHHLAAADLHGAGVHRVRVAVRRDVVVVALEGAPGYAQCVGERVQFLVGEVADQVGPHPAVARPGGRVDVHRHDGVPPMAGPSAPTAATFTPAL